MSNGGNVFIDPIGDVQVRSINTQGGTLGRGGTVDITAGRFFRATDGFIDRTNLRTSISSAGGLGGGDIRIWHGGGALRVPFIIGDASINGTAAAISNRTFTLRPYQVFFGSFTLGNIQILTNAPSQVSPLPSPLLPQDPILQSDNPSSETPKTLPNDPDSPRVDPGTGDIDQKWTTDYQQHNQPQDTSHNSTSTASQSTPTSSPGTDSPSSTSESTGSTSIAANQGLTPDASASSNPRSAKTLTEIRTQLHQIEQATGVRPALIYAVFVPGMGTVGQLSPQIPASGSPAPNSTSDPGKTKALDSAFLKQLQAQAVTPTASPNASAESQPLQSYRLQVPPEENYLELYLVTAHGPVIRQPVFRATQTLTIATATELRDTATKSIGRYLPSAQKLYQWLVQPLEAELQARKINNLVFLADEGLRSLPYAALHDGRGFLVERYSLGLMPTLSLTDTRFQDIKQAQVLAMGTSKFPTNPQLADLPAAEAEAKAIAEQLWRGQVFVNEHFTLANLKHQRQLQPFGIIHLATHANFEVGEAKNSYIQLWDRSISLDQIRQLGWGNPPAELVVLSACRTSFGDKEAELGFAGFAVQAGVKSVLGSLWYADDGGTLALMTEFYQKLRVVPIKAEALRQAQVAMIRKQTRIEHGQLILSDRTIPLPTHLTLGQPDLSHPYYWSGFTMIGSPW